MKIFIAEDFEEDVDVSTYWYVMYEYVLRTLRYGRAKRCSHGTVSYVRGPCPEMKVDSEVSSR